MSYNEHCKPSPRLPIKFNSLFRNELIALERYYFRDWSGDEQAMRHKQSAIQLNHIFDRAQLDLSVHDSLFNALREHKAIASANGKFPSPIDVAVGSTKFPIVQKPIAKIDDNYIPILEEFKSPKPSIYALIWIKPSNEQVSSNEFFISNLPVRIVFHLTDGKHPIVTFVAQGEVPIYRHLVLDGFKFDLVDESSKVLTYQSYEFRLGVPMQVTLVFKDSDMLAFRDAVNA